MKYLIVSADDLGLADSINRGIIKGYKDGIVNSLNVIPSGHAFYDAAALLKVLKPKEISAHLALTETMPVTEADKIPTLVAEDGAFHKHYVDLLPDFFLKKINRDEMYLELKNQMERLKSLGIPITNISSHEHIHVVPGMLEIFIKLAKEYNVPSIRYLHEKKLHYPYHPKKLFRKIVIWYFGPKMRKMLDDAQIWHTDNFLGFFDSGNMREELLAEMLNNLPEGTAELVTHPGLISSDVLDRCIFHRNCETDLAAVMSRRVKKAITDNNIKLISFSDLAKLPKS